MRYYFIVLVSKLINIASLPLDMSLSLRVFNEYESELT